MMLETMSCIRFLEENAPSRNYQHLFGRDLYNFLVAHMGQKLQ